MLCVALVATSVAALAPATSIPAMALALASPLTRAHAATKYATQLRISAKEDTSIDTLVALDLAAHDCAGASRDVHELHGARLVETVRRVCGASAALASAQWQNGDVTAAADTYEAARREHPEPLEPDEIHAYAAAGRYELAARTLRHASPELETAAMTLEVLGGLRASPPTPRLELFEKSDWPPIPTTAESFPEAITDARHLASTGRGTEALARIDAYLAANPPPVVDPRADPSREPAPRRDYSVEALGLALELAIASGEAERAARYAGALPDYAKSGSDGRIALLHAHSAESARAAGFDDRTSIGRAIIAGDGETLAHALRLQPNVAGTLAFVGKTMPRGKGALALLLRTEAPLLCAEPDSSCGCDPRSLLGSLAQRAQAARALGDGDTANAADQAAERIRSARQGAFLTEDSLQALATVGAQVRYARAPANGH